MIETFLQCPRKYKTLYLDGRSEKQNSSALHFGTAMHNALNAHFKGEDAFYNFNVYWDYAKTQNLEYDRYTWEHLKNLATEKFLPRFIRLHAKNIKDPKMEETLEHEIMEGVTLQGTYDACGEISGQLTMLDYKTSQSRYPVHKIHRNPQLYIYSYLYQKKYNTLPKAVAYKVFVKSEESIQTVLLPLTQSKLDAMMENVREIIQDIVSRKKYYCSSNCFCITPKECFPNG